MNVSTVFSLFNLYIEWFLLYLNKYIVLGQLLCIYSA